MMLVIRPRSHCQSDASARRMPHAMIIRWQAGASSTPTRSCRSSFTRKRRRRRFASLGWLRSTSRSRPCSDSCRRRSPVPTALRYSPAMPCPKADDPLRRRMPATSSATSRPSAMAERSCLANRSHHPAIAWTSNSKEQGRPGTPAAATGAPRSDRCSGNTSSARRCTRSAFRRRGAWRWRRPASRSIARKCSMARC